MDTPNINITGGVTVNVMQPQQTMKSTPSLQITPFIKAAVMEVDKDLLWFNTHVSKNAKLFQGKLASELTDIIRERAEVMERMAGSDYNTELVTVFAAEIAAASFLLYKHYGGEPVLKNG